jgi:hypothetical protein
MFGAGTQMSSRKAVVLVLAGLATVLPLAGQKALIPPAADATGKHVALAIGNYPRSPLVNPAQNFNAKQNSRRLE